MTIGVALLAFTLSFAAAASVAGEEMEIRSGPRVRVAALGVSVGFDRPERSAGLRLAVRF
jgi:hypothetical protein